MKTGIKAALITGILGVVGTVIAAIIGINVGKSTEQKNIQNEINEVMGDMVNIIGDGNEVTFNDIKDLVEDYQDLQTQNKSLIEQNTKYFDNLMIANNKLDDSENESITKVKELEEQISKMPIVDYKNYALSINAEDISINKNNSMINIDGKDYFSKEVVEKILQDDQALTIKDDTIFIGRVIADKANLLDKHINECYEVYTFSSEKDSFGNNHLYGLCFNAYDKYSDSYIRYNLNQQYAYMDFWISVPENTRSDCSGELIIGINDNEIIYTSEKISLLTKPFKVEKIPIKNCDLIEIWLSNNNGRMKCLITDIIVYN